jgi:hypothetical protein
MGITSFLKKWVDSWAVGKQPGLGCGERGIHVTPFGTHAIAGLATNAVLSLDDRHHFAFNFIVIVVFIHDFAFLIQRNEGHNAAATRFETPTAAQTRIPINLL